MPVYKKVDPETFSFCVNNIFAKKQVLFNICGLMQSLQRVIRYNPPLKGCMNLATANLSTSAISKICAWNRVQLFDFCHIQGFSQLYSAI